MAGIFSKVSAFARSAEGQKLIKQAQQAAKDPANRARVQQLGNKLRTRAVALSNEYKAGAKGEDVKPTTGAAGTDAKPADAKPADAEPAAEPGPGTPPTDL
jgi:hypothetical protein